jgi:hypothetical protein
MRIQVLGCPARIPTVPTQSPGPCPHNENAIRTPADPKMEIACQEERKDDHGYS